MSRKPLISLILCVKDGMPYLPQALESVTQQSYREFELIVQDGCSADGSLEVIEAFRGAPHIDVESAEDGGIGPAYNRALSRCRGEIVGSIDADNLLQPAALEFAAAAFAADPDCAAIYGSSNMIAADGTFLYGWTPEPFDVLKLLSCDLVPPFAASYFSRRACGEHLHFDPTMRTCVDFDLWLRLSHLPLRRVDAVLCSTRISPNSMTCRATTYDQFCEDKIGALQRFFDRLGRNHVVETLEPSCIAGIYAWAALAVLQMEGDSEQFQRYVDHGRMHDPDSPRWQAIEKAAEPTPAPELACDTSPSEEPPGGAPSSPSPQAVPLSRLPRPLRWLSRLATAPEPADAT